jgi:hypothetical protein
VRRRGTAWRARGAGRPPKPFPTLRATKASASSAAYRESRSAPLRNSIAASILPSPAVRSKKSQVEEVGDARGGVAGVGRPGVWRAASCPRRRRSCRWPAHRHGHHCRSFYFFVGADLGLGSSAVMREWG